MKTRSCLKALSVFCLICFFSYSSISQESGDVEILPDDSAVASAVQSGVNANGEQLNEALKEPIEADRNRQAQVCTVTSEAGLAGKCGSCAHFAADTCQDPNRFAETSGINSVVSNVVAAAPTVAALAGIAGGGEGAAQATCYANALGALGAESGAKAVSLRCKEWRTGFDSTQRVSGCQKICSDAIVSLNNEYAQLAAAGANTDLILKQIEKAKSDLTSCQGETAEAEQGALAQALGFATQGLQLQACAEGAGGDEALAEDLIDTEVDCNNAEYANFTQCLELAEKTLDDYNLESLSADLVDLDGESGLDDDFVPPPDAADFTPDSQGGAGAPSGPGFASGSAGGFGGSAGNGTAAKASSKNGGYSGKAKNLISGHRSSASTGNGGKRRNKKKYSKFKLAKDKLAEEKNEGLKVAAVYKKAGIDPNVSGFIFKRITNRFNSSCDPKAFVGCLRNKTSWYEQNKFKKSK